MRERELVPIFEHLCQKFPYFDFRKRLLFVCPVKSVLRGINFDPSGWSKTDFYVHAFLSPLCVTKDDYYLTFGFRLRILGDPWSTKMADMPAKLERLIHEEAMPFFEKAETPEGFAVASAQFLGNPHAWKARAFCVARTGRTRQAIDLIDDYIPRLNLESHWQKDLADGDLARLPRSARRRSRRGAAAARRVGGLHDRQSGSRRLSLSPARAAGA